MTKSNRFITILTMVVCNIFKTQQPFEVVVHVLKETRVVFLARKGVKERCAHWYQAIKLRVFSNHTVLATDHAVGGGKLVIRAFKLKMPSSCGCHSKQ